MDVHRFFDFLAEDDIRFRGTRIGIETVLYAYLHEGQSAEAIAERYPSLRLADIHAAILYYLEKRTEMDAYLTSWLTEGQERRAAQRQTPPPIVVKLQQTKAQQVADEAFA